MQLIKICTAKAVLRGKCVAQNKQTRKEERSKINRLTSHVRKLEKNENIKQKELIRSRRKSMQLKIKTQ